VSIHHNLKVAACFSDGSASTFVLGKDDTLQADQKWKEARLRAGQRYVGLEIARRFALVTVLRFCWSDRTFSGEFFLALLMEQCD